MRRSPWRRFLATAALGTTLLLASAPVQAQSPAPITPEQLAAMLTDPAFNQPDTSVHFVGVTSDPNVYVAVVDPGDGTVSIYLCDGADLGVWLEGSITDGTIAAENVDGATATGTTDGSTATGSVTLADGSSLEFSAPVAVPPAGLYTREFVHEGEPMVSRTIQLSDGTAKGKTTAAKCAALDIKWDIHITVATDQGATQDQRTVAGNIASRTFRDAIRLGCKWAKDMMTQ